MKKILALILVLVFTFVLAGCSEEPAKKEEHNHNHSKPSIQSNGTFTSKPLADAPAFSYEEATKNITDKTPGVKRDEFKNTEKTTLQTVTDAARIAKTECDINSDSFNIYYDTKTGITQVLFYTEGQLGDTQTVYLDKDGKTILIVYEE